MLGALRASSKSWVSKVLLLLLVASFAVWGISDQITGGVGGNTVLTAGQTTVSTDEYRLAYNRAFRNLQAQFGPSVTREQARLFGVENQVLSTLAAGAVLDEQARIMELGLTRDGLAQVISEDARNWTNGGTFDRGLLTMVLRQLDLTEEEYVQTLEQAAVRQQIIQAAASDLRVPSVLLDALFSHNGESRDVSYLRIEESQLPELEPASEDEIAGYFEENATSYRAPEYREIRYVRLTADVVADPEAISQSDVVAEYERTRDRFGQPERRTIQQLIYPTQEAAETARERILAGESFEAAAEALGRSTADITLGEFARDDVPDQAIAEAAFALEDTASISEVVDGAFGSILVRVTEISPEQTRPLEEVEATLRDELARIEAEQLINVVRNNFEDAVAGGATKQEAADQQQLDMVVIDAIDSRGRGPSGEEPDTAPPELVELLAEAFQSEVLQRNQPIPAGDAGFLWYEVADVTPDRDRTLDEVRDRLIDDLNAQRSANQLQAEADRILSEIEGGTSIDEVAGDTEYPFEKKFGLTRNANDAEFGRDGVAAVFAVGPQGTGSTSLADGSGLIVFRVEAINQPLGDGTGLPENQQQTVASSLSDDVLDQLIGRAQREFQVTSNPNAIERAQQLR